LLIKLVNDHEKKVGLAAVHRLKAYFINDYQICLIKLLGFFSSLWRYLLGFEGVDQLIHVDKDRFVTLINGGNAQRNRKMGLGRLGRKSRLSCGVCHAGVSYPSP